MALKKTRLPSRSELRTRRRRRTVISFIILFVIGATFTAWSPFVARFAGDQIIRWSDHYRVRNTIVLGNKVIPADQILKLAAIPARTSLLSVPVGSIKTRLQQHAWIRYAYVRRRLPDTIEIRVVEREPVATLRGEGVSMITADSMVVSPLTPGWVWDLPILTPPRPLKVKPGTAVTDAQTLALLRETLVIRRVSEQAWRNLSELYYENGQMHAALSHPAVDVLLGQGVTELAWSGALKLLNGTFQADLRRNPRLDLRFPGKIVVSDNFRSTAEQVRG